MSALMRCTRAFPLWSLVCVFISMEVLAHHGSNSNPDLYLAENLLELEGEITGVFWRNPHPRLKLTVVGDDGEQMGWELELAGSINSLGRQGLSGDFVHVGDQVRAAGVVSRRDPTSIGLLHLLLPSGEELVNGNRENRWSEERFATTRRAFDPAVVRDHDEASHVLQLVLLPAYPCTGNFCSTKQ